MTWTWERRKVKNAWDLYLGKSSLLHTVQTKL